MGLNKNSDVSQISRSDLAGYSSGSLRMIDSTRLVLSNFRRNCTVTRGIYSMSSFFYWIPAAALCTTYKMSIDVVTSCTMLNVMIGELIIQSPLSYMSDTHEFFKHCSFHDSGIWNRIDIVFAVVTFFTQLYVTPKFCESLNQLVIYLVGVVTSLIFFFVGQYAGRSHLFGTTRSIFWIWVFSHTMWHTCLPMVCTYVILF